MDYSFSNRIMALVEGDFESSEFDYKLPRATSELLEQILDDEETSTTDVSPTSTPVPHLTGKSNSSDLASECKTKIGSKKVQQTISKSSPEEIKNLVILIAPKIAELMTDVYGNYMCQSLFQSANSAQRLFLLRSMKKSLVKIAKDVRGTHSLQTVISMASLEEEETLYKEEFSGHIVELATHNYASHVVQRLIITVKDKSYIMNELRGSCTALAKDKLGLCVIKKCLDQFEVYKELIKDSLILVQDPYGNYAIQKVFEVWGKDAYQALYYKFRKSIPQLCVQKFSSNVIEKCMRINFLREKFFPELISEEKLQLLLNCPYGCYVLKTAAECGQPSLKSELAKRVKSIMHLLHQKKLKKRWQEIFDLLGL